MNAVQPQPQGWKDGERLLKGQTRPLSRHLHLRWIVMMEGKIQGGLPSPTVEDAQGGRGDLVNQSAPIAPHDYEPTIRS